LPPPPLVLTSVSCAFDFVLLGCQSPGALESFLEDPWGSFQRCARVALTTWFSQEFLSCDHQTLPNEKPRDSNRGVDAQLLEDILPPRVFLWLMQQRQQHNLNSSHHQQAAPLHLHVDPSVYLVPHSIPSAFLTDFTLPPLTAPAGGAAAGDQSPAVWHPPSRTISTQSAVTVALRAVVVGIMRVPRRNTSPIADAAAPACVELAQLRPLHEPSHWADHRTRRTFFLDTSVVANLVHLSPSDRSCFVLGQTVSWMGQWFPPTSSVTSASSRSGGGRLVVDVMCVFHTHSTSSPSPYSMQHLRNDYIGAPIIDDLLQQHGTELVSLREAAQCWQGIFSAWTCHAPACPRGWFLPSHGMEIPAVWVAVMISSSLPSCALRLGCVVCDPTQINCISTWMRALEMLHAANVRSVGYTHPDRRLASRLVVSPCGTHEIVQAGLLNCCVGSTAFVGDLDRYASAHLRAIRIHLLRTSLLPPSSDDAALPPLTSIGMVCGRANAAKRETSVEEYLADCDIVTCFSRPPNAMTLVRELAEIIATTTSASKQPSLSDGGNQKEEGQDSMVSLRTPWDTLCRILHYSRTEHYTLPPISPLASTLIERYFSFATAAARGGGTLRNSTMNTLVNLACAHAVLRTVWSLETRPEASARLQWASDAPTVMSAVEVHSVDAVFSIFVISKSIARFHDEDKDVFSALFPKHNFVQDVCDTIQHLQRGADGHRHIGEGDEGSDEGQRLRLLDEQLQQWWHDVYLDRILCDGRDH
jgi:hypothetical protein